MNRLLLAENVYRVIQKEFDDWHISYTVGQEIMDRIKALPEDVVRCKDCKYYYAGYECLAEGYGIEQDPNWFCAGGERRVNND